MFGGLAALFLLLGAGFRIYHAAATQSYVQVEGRIVDFRHGYPVIGYEYGGYEGRIAAHSRASWQRIGDSITVQVDPASPDQAMDDTLPMLGLIFILVGGSMLIPAVCLAVISRRHTAILAELRTYGQRVRVMVTEVKPNYVVSINKRHPWRVYAECRHPVTGAGITVHSGDLMHTSLQPGSYVDVLFDPMNEKRYVMDVQEDA